MLIAREMRQQTQFDLAVVGTQEQASRIRYHRLADQFAPLGTYRQVLQVGVRRTESSRSRDGLVVGRMYLTRLRIDIAGQRGDVGRDQFFQFAIVQYLTYYRMAVFDAEQHLLRGGILARLRFLSLIAQVHGLKQQVTYLARRVDIQRRAGHRVYLLLQRLQFGGQLVLSLLEFGHIDAHTGLLHLAEYAHQRQAPLPHTVPIGWHPL